VFLGPLVDRQHRVEKGRGGENSPSTSSNLKTQGREKIGGKCAIEGENLIGRNTPEVDILLGHETKKLQGGGVTKNGREQVTSTPPTEPDRIICW